MSDKRHPMLPLPKVVARAPSGVVTMDLFTKRTESARGGSAQVIQTCKAHEF